MLRPSSSHYYACYYALLCLLYYHQQQALAVTIVIDGATTNEWATKDEYQRLVDSSQGQLAAESGSSGATGDKLKQHHHQQHPHQHPKQLQLQLHHQRQQSATANVATKQNAEQSLEQILRSFNGGSGAGGDQSGASNFRLIPASRPVGEQASDDGLRVVTGGAARRLLQELNDAASTGDQQQQLTWPSSSSRITALRSPASAEADDGGNSNNYNNNNNQDNSFRNPASSPNDRDELELALDRLDLIERERKVHLKQLKQLESLEGTVETGLAAALSRASLGNGRGAAGARSISDLVSPTDTDLEFSWKTHGKGNGAFRRETTGPNRYCGDDFIDLAHHICNGSFANPYDPIIVQPKVSKRKRSVGYQTTDTRSEDDEQLLSNEPGAGFFNTEPEASSSSSSMKPTVARQRKLRTLQAINLHEGDDSSSPESLSTSSSSVHDGNIGNQNHNHNHQKKQQQHQRYLSKSNFINNDDINNNNLSANRNRQARSDSTRLRLARDIDAPSNICCKKQCNWDDIKELYCKREPAES